MLEEVPVLLFCKYLFGGAEFVLLEELTFGLEVFAIEFPEVELEIVSDYLIFSDGK